MRKALLRAAGAVGSVWLHNPRLARAPLALYRMRLGFLLGTRILMLEHRGRSSGVLRQVVLERIDRPAPETIRVVSGMGPRAQWYRNLMADPRCFVSTGRLRRAAATARRVPQEEVPTALERYAAENPRDWQVLDQVMRPNLPPGIDYGEYLPMVDLVLHDAREQPRRRRR